MKELNRFYLFITILLSQLNPACSLCEMPRAWLGSWYQHGMNSSLQITINHVQTKGLCSDTHPDKPYYLFTDQSTSCIRCLLVIQRHVNLLQYRESECIDANELSDVTSCSNMIALDATLYTLHRSDSKSQSCPIQPSYLVTSSIRNGVTCPQSISSSSINECANDHQFHLHLTPCSPYQSILNLQLVCVGTWIKNFHTYFIARIIFHSSKHQRKSPNNQYACFRFLTQQNSSSSLSLDMATDDSCSDLYSKHMSTTMILSSRNRTVVRETDQSCVFPTALQTSNWYSINETIQMMITNNDIELTGLNKRFHCHKIISSEKSVYIYRIHSFTNCRVREECLRLVQRTNNVLELSTVSLSKDNSCNHLHTDDYNLYLTLWTKSTSTSNGCPSYIGHLVFQSNFDHYQKRSSFHMSVGCGQREELVISDLEQRSIIQIETCLASWRSDDSLTTYLIARSTHSNASYCLNFQMTHPILIRNNSNGCSSHQSADENSLIIYSARRTHSCSRSSQLSFDFLVPLIGISMTMINIRRPKVSVFIFFNHCKQ